MLFNSLAFLIFLLVVFCLYWAFFNRNIRWRNIFLLCCSYFFYGVWDYRFLVLIFISSVCDYCVGLKLGNVQHSIKRKAWLWVSIFINLGLLGFFKYYNFFIDSLSAVIKGFGFQSNLVTLSLVLPIGISFYTFQTLSYSIDIYRKKITPTHDAIAFLSFVSFFPQLVAGPIEKARDLLPQFFKKKQFSYTDGVDGLKQILWGMFKKVVIADNIITIIAQGLENSEHTSGLQLLLGIFLMTIHVYCDFSGYSDIALGIAKLFGFNLSQNFAYPFFSRSLTELWKRWHISLTSWFWEYIYLPLGGSKINKGITIRNVFVVFLISGFWHGADWTFIAFGFCHALTFTFSIIISSRKKFNGITAQNMKLPSLIELKQMITTFCLFSFPSLVFFSNSVEDAANYTCAIFANDFFGPVMTVGGTLISPLTYGFYALFVFVMFAFEWCNRRNPHGLFRLNLPLFGRWMVYLMLTLTTLIYFGESNEFVYFQF